MVKKRRKRKSSDRLEELELKMWKACLERSQKNPSYMT